MADGHEGVSRRDPSALAHPTVGVDNPPLDIGTAKLDLTVHLRRDAQWKLEVRHEFDEVLKRRVSATSDANAAADENQALHDATEHRAESFIRILPQTQLDQVIPQVLDQVNTHGEALGEGLRRRGTRQRGRVRGQELFRTLPSQLANPVAVYGSAQVRSPPFSTADQADNGRRIMTSSCREATGVAPSN